MKNRIKKEIVKDILFREDFSDLLFKLRGHMVAQMQVAEEGSQEEKYALDTLQAVYKLEKFSMDSGVTKINKDFDYDNIEVGKVIPLLKITETNMSPELESAITSAGLCYDIVADQGDDYVPYNKTLELKIESYQIVDADVINKEWQEKEK